MLLLFFLIWILLSGSLSAGNCLLGAVLSLALYIFFRRIMDGGSSRRPLSLRRAWKSLRYLVFLFMEMLKAGIAVMKLIFSREEPDPLLVRFRTPLNDPASRTILSNSITLTAGTITVEDRDGRLYVHALDRSLADGIESTEFQRRLLELTPPERGRQAP